MGFGAKRAARLPVPLALAALVVGLTAAPGLWREARARGLGDARVCIETPLVAALRPVRVAAWADKLGPIEIERPRDATIASIRLYGMDGEIDPAALDAFE